MKMVLILDFTPLYCILPTCGHYYSIRGSKRPLPVRLTTATAH